MLQRLAPLVGNINIEPRRLLYRLTAFVLVSICLVLLFRRPNVTTYFDHDQSHLTLDPNDPIRIAREYASNGSLHAPFKDKFYEAGVRLRHVAGWLADADHLDDDAPGRRQDLVVAAESVAVGVAPFLAKTSSETPLSDLRESFVPGSQGIVIPVGGKDEKSREAAVRFAGHLISSLRQVLDCQLPIQIAHAGDIDLPEADRERIQALEGATDISFLNVLDLFDDERLQLAKGGWAIKAFAALGSSFEHVIILDADAVFLQKPEIMFNQHAFRQYGAYLFHDRLLWQHAFQDRHEWFRDQIKEPSPAMEKSLVWTEDYAEECDSGAVVLDKSRPDVLMGLLHIAWQNTQPVRDEVTYKITYGDKESWWLGLELAGSGYEFESHYGSMLGWGHRAQDDKPDKGNNGAGRDRVCSFVIAHLDDEDELIWYNGSLLKNKLVDPFGYELPEFWMVDGKWLKGKSKKDMSCMVDAPMQPLSEEQKRILELSIKAAKRVDLSLSGAQTDE
jgi:hypothetical protein